MQSVGRRRAVAGDRRGMSRRRSCRPRRAGDLGRRLQRQLQGRAIFDDAGNIIPGEQVKIAGVKVGKVTSVTPTPQAKAAVVLDISNDGFKDFRDDASCESARRR